RDDRRRARWRNALTEERPHTYVVPDGAPPAGFAAVTRRAGAKRRTPERSGGVDGGERGDTIDRPADGDWIDWTRARGRARRKLPTLYALISCAVSRGRGLRFILQAEGRAVSHKINRARGHSESVEPWPSYVRDTSKGVPSNSYSGAPSACWCQR